MLIRASHRKRPRFIEPSLQPRHWTIVVADAVSDAISAVWLPVMIFIVPLLCYLPVLGLGFVSDDFFYHAAFTWDFNDVIEKLALIHSGELEFPFFRPLAIASFRLDYMIRGADPIGFHLTNLILHSVNAVLLYHLVRYLGMKKMGAAVCALFFGLYPAGPEAVTWISGRFDLLAMLFLLIAYIAWCAARLRNETWWMIPSVIAFFFAMLSKENAVAGLLVLPLIDWMLHEKTRHEWNHGVGWHWKWYIVFFALVVSFIGFRLWLFGDLGGYPSEHSRSAFFAAQWPDIWNNFVKGDLWMLITPVSRILWTEWPIALQTAFTAVGALTGLALIGVLVQFSIRAKMTDEGPLVRIISGVLWAVVFLLPVATLDGVKGSLDYSRFLYIPAAGLAMWIGLAADYGFRNSKLLRWASIVLILALLLLSGTAVRRHNAAWLHAGEIAGRIHAAMATHTVSIPDGSTIFLVNYPWLYKGAHCAPVKYEGYIEFRDGATGIETEIKRMPSEDVPVWWEGIKQNWNKPGIGFEWDESQGSVRVLPGFINQEISDETFIEFPDTAGAESSYNNGIREIDVSPEQI